MRKLVLLHRRLSSALAGIGAAGIALAAVVYIAEVIARYFFAAPLNFSSDLGSYMLCTSIFLCLPAITAERRHVAIGYLQEVLPKRFSSYHAWATCIVSALVVALVGVFVALEAIRQYEQHILTSMANQIPRWWLTSIAAFGLVSAAIHFVTAPEQSDQDFIE